MDRLAVDNLLHVAATEIEMKIFYQITQSSAKKSERKKRQVIASTEGNPPSTENVENTENAEDDENTGDDEYTDNTTEDTKDVKANPPRASGSRTGACGQYFGLGTIFPNRQLALQSKVILQVSSFDDLFTLPVMQRLCAIDSIVIREMQAAGADADIKYLYFSFNLPYYTMCMNFQKSSDSCTLLDAKEISNFRSTLLGCRTKKPSFVCSTSLAKQLNNMIIERNAAQIGNRSPLYIAVILPVINMYRGRHNIEFYDKLLLSLSREFNGEGYGKLKLAGAQFGAKDFVFEDYIILDIQLGAIAVGLVIILVLIYTSSFFFTLCIALGLILSIGVAFFFYAVVFRIKFFPFLNLLAIILVVAVGADDAFFFIYQYRKYKNSEEEERKHVLTGLGDALSHAAIAMFVTSVTTAVAFFANLTSSILVLRCFGVYAGIMMFVNYVFVVTVLPAAVIVTEVKLRNCCRTKKMGWITKARQSVASAWETVFGLYIPTAVYYIKFPMVAIGLTVLAVSIYAVVKTPGIRLPEKNSMQFLRSDHPYEWYDENAVSLFDFSNGDPIKIKYLIMWGILPTTTASLLIPKDIGKLELHTQFIDALANNLKTFEQKSISKKRLSDCFLEFGRISPMTPFDDFIYNDTDSPVYDNEGNLVAYYLSVQSVHNFSTIYKEMKPFFDSLNGIHLVIRQCKVREFHETRLLASQQLTLIYDLLDRILHGTAEAVLIALLVSTVVIVLTTLDFVLSLIAIICIATVVTFTIATALWIGWTINVVEATIIVLTIGMGFDYCLHFAVAFKLLGKDAFRSVSLMVGVPVLLAAMSSFIAGFPLVFARTQAFFEIGVFLMLLTTFSFTIAVFLFPSAVSSVVLLYPKKSAESS